MSSATTDILILHGKSLALVSELKLLFETLEISAGTVLDQPSESRPQRNRVSERIKTCKLALVLVTFDEDAPQSRSPRPNVLHELTLCVEKRPKDTLVLLEMRDGVPVDLGSNLHGHLIIIQFTASEFHKLYPPLLKELRNRSLFTPVPGRSTLIPSNLLVARHLNDFLDKMDQLWAAFDKASFKILRHDYKTQERFSNSLDKFFICYWKVFHALIRKKVSEDEIKVIAGEQYQHSQECLEKVWQDTTDALMEHAAKLKSLTKIRSLPSLLAPFQKADLALKEVRKVDRIESRIQIYMETAETLDVFVKKLETGR